MNPQSDQRLRAIALMRQALELLDIAKEYEAAAHLQHAISIVDREPRATV